LKLPNHKSQTSKIPPAKLTYIRRPPVLRTSWSGTLAPLAGGSRSLVAGLQSATLIAASYQPLADEQKIQIPSINGTQKIKKAK